MYGVINLKKCQYFTKVHAKLPSSNPNFFFFFLWINRVQNLNHMTHTHTKWKCFRLFKRYPSKGLGLCLNKYISKIIISIFVPLKRRRAADFETGCQEEPHHPLCKDRIGTYPFRIPINKFIYLLFYRSVGIKKRKIDMKHLAKLSSTPVGPTHYSLKSQHRPLLNLVFPKLPSLIIKLPT